MSKRYFSLLVGLISQAGCVIYDDSRLRPPLDAALGDMHDGASSVVDAPFVNARDVEIDARDASADEGSIDVPSIDASVEDRVDAEEKDARAQTDGDVAETSTGPDVFDAPLGGDVDADSRADDPDVTDSASDNVVVGCPVGFTVSGVGWETTGAVTDAGWDGSAPSVRVVGSAPSMGAWEPTTGAAMVETAPGTWFVSLVLRDEALVEFKFVKLYPGHAPEWEAWTPFDSNRALYVSCTTDAGGVRTDGGAAVGRSYGGAFGVRPSDATK